MGTVNERLKELRGQTDITLKQMADIIGVSEATVQRYESGKITKVPYKAIVAYSQKFHVSPNYIMGWEDRTTSVFIATADVDGKNIVASTVTIPKPDDYDYKKRVAAYISYLSKNEYARNLIQEASKSSDEDIQLATEFLMRLNKKER